MFPNSVKTQKLLLKGLFLQNLSMLLPSFLKECLDRTLRQFTPPNSREATAHQLTPPHLRKGSSVMQYLL